MASAATERITTAPVGREFRSTANPDFTYTVGEACDQNVGYWYCVTHDELFRNQLAKDSHISKGEHELAWTCMEHGPEAP